MNSPKARSKSHKNSDSNEPKDQGKLIAIGVVVALIALGALFYRPSSTAPQASKVTNEIKEKTPPVVLDAAPIKNDEVKAAAIQAEMSKLDAAGVVLIPANVSQDHMIFAVKTKSIAQFCRTGDMDLLRMVPSDPVKKGMLLTLEDLSNKKVMAKQSLSVRDIDSGSTMPVELPLQNGTYGLYYCWDQDKSGSCSKKAILPKAVWDQPDNEARQTALNKFFYYQTIVVKNGGLFILPTGSWGPANRKKLVEQLGEWIKPYSSILETTDKYLDVLRPLPARLSGRDIQVAFMYNTGCE